MLQYNVHECHYYARIVNCITVKIILVLMA